MNKQCKYIIITAVIVSVIGTLQHFLYDLSGHNFLVGLFCPTNESTWEHMKLVFFPMFLCNICLNNKLKSTGVHPEGQLLMSSLIGTWLIPFLFYTYRGILGFGISAADIATFYISVILAYLFVWHTINSLWKKSCITALYILCFIQLFAFILFSYTDCRLGIFVPPVK